MRTKYPMIHYNLIDYNVGNNNFINAGHLFIKWLLDNNKLDEMSSNPAFIKLGIGNADIAIGTFEKGEYQHIEYAAILVISYNHGLHFILKNGKDYPSTIRQL